MSFWPKKITFQDIAVNSLGSAIAWIIGSLTILVITFMISSIINIPGAFQETSLWLKTNAVFPLIFSIITLIGTTITVFLTYYILNLTDSERYKKNVIILGQITLLSILTYIFITPIYLYAGIQNTQYILYVFLVHTIIIIFWTSILLEILNNYRYILTGIYGSFIGLFVSAILTLLIFSVFSHWLAQLIALIVLLPIINCATTFFKQVFEMFYFYYYQYTNQDGLWDIFYQIEMEEKELLQQEEEKNSI